MPASIVARYDGSQPSETAVWWAAAEASRRQARLRLTYALPSPLVSSPPGLPSVPLPTDLLREAAESVLAELAQRIRSIHPQLPVDAVVTFVGASQALLQEATSAELVVLGSHGLGGWRDLAMGSVSAHVATHATCAVVVVPPRWESGAVPGGVVVGVDGSEHSLQAIGFAFEQARRAPLTAVMAWQDPLSTGPRLSAPTGLRPGRARAAVRGVARRVAGRAPGQVPGRDGARATRPRHSPRSADRRRPIGRAAGGRVPRPGRVSWSPARLDQPGTRAPPTLPGGG
ncbi:nucleotide-binding universal stress UspA family protein [Kribbella orskensis]|uniref:Nucleotide-binding universal stress UspA family protein n=1 Tax=Kribbella orskensis TaxID=2512216 RepID=A0ABY2B5N5_9ACTN|nr:universal stress protein [Kribbella orskensis]TCN27649.1 nucleotide-binding universal stress UspA family protein [Kribbella sp. VKM Ac-2500]TCO07571.1 nucleotide-binding universal stress UspA family protein [Kribbella orskensis]